MFDSQTSTTNETSTAEETTEADPSSAASKEEESADSAAVEEADSSEDSTEESAPAITADAILEATEIPEGMEFIKDDPLLGEFVDILNTPDLTPEALGPKILGLYAKAQEANVAAHVATQEEWQTEVTNDPTIGGDKLDATLEGIERVMRDYASAQGEDAQTVDEALRGAFDITGAGNNPAIIRFLHWIASQSGEGAPLSGESVGGDLSREERMFGT